MSRKPTPSEATGMAWWNRLTEPERAYWCRVADSARPVDAWQAFQRGEDGPRAADQSGRPE